MCVSIADLIVVVLAVVAEIITIFYRVRMFNMRNDVLRWEKISRVRRASIFLVTVIVIFSLDMVGIYGWYRILIAIGALVILHLITHNVFNWQWAI